MKKIKVLHCVTSMNRGGLETFIMNYYRYINRDRVEFDFLVQREGIFDYSDEIKKLGGHIYRIPSFSPFRIKRYNQALDDFFSKHAGEYDIIHAHNNSFAMYPLRAAKKYNYPIRIAHSHIADTKFDLIRAPFVFYNKIKLKKACNFRFACSKKAGEWLFGKQDFIVIKNAIDLKKFKFNHKTREEYRKKLGIDKSTVLLGNVGRFEKQKNQIFLIKVMKLMKKERKDAKLVLIGEGSLRKRLEDVVEKNGLRDTVIFCGNVNNPYDYLSAMDVFVFPSLFEGLGIVAIEAQANGLPCIVSNDVVHECKVTPLVSFLPITSGAISMWVDKSLENAKKPRSNYFKELDAAGYEITVAVTNLEKQYLSLIRNFRNTDNSMERLCF